MRGASLFLGDFKLASVAILPRRRVDTLECTLRDLLDLERLLGVAGMSLTKHYLKTKPVCKVRFRVPPEAAGSATTVHLVGEFNGWDRAATPMKRLKDGSFVATVDLEPSHEYQFRYLIDETTWENDWHADRYAPAPYGENSVVVV